MSVGAYATLAHAAIDERRDGPWNRGRERRHRAVSPRSPGRHERASAAGAGVRERILAEVEADPTAAHERLGSLDPRSAAAVHVNDTRRLVRALELAEIGSSLVPDDDRLWGSATRHPTLIVGIDVPAARAGAPDRRPHERDVRAEVWWTKCERRSPQGSHPLLPRRSG